MDSFTLRTNRVIVDLKKVIYARLYWENQFGHKRDTALEPSQFSWMNVTYNRNEKHCEGITFYKFAQAEGKIDQWTQKVYLQLANSHSLIYTGDKAMALYGAYCKIVFHKKKEKGKK